MKRLSYITLLLCMVGLLASSSPLFGEDNAAQPSQANGEHVLISIAPGVNLSDLNRQMNIGISDKILAGKNIRSSGSPDKDLVNLTETLFMQVCDILDMHLYSLQINIQVTNDYSQLADEYRRLFNEDLHNRRSFYVFNQNRIFITSSDFTPAVLGHEIAHAIISHYFVVQPPIKIQEVLAGYVEYNLRKLSK